MQHDKTFNDHQFALVIHWRGWVVDSKSIRIKIKCDLCSFVICSNKNISFISLQVQIENDKLRRDRESRGSRIDLSNLCVSSNATTIVNTMRQQNEQKATSRSIRNLSGLIIDSQGNSIPLSPVSSNTSSSSSDNVVEHHKPTPMTPSGTAMTLITSLPFPSLIRDIIVKFSLFE